LGNQQQQQHEADDCWTAGRIGFLLIRHGNKTCRSVFGFDLILNNAHKNGWNATPAGKKWLFLHFRLTREPISLWIFKMDLTRTNSTDSP
jgi:hypothetical protein